MNSSSPTIHAARRRCSRHWFQRYVLRTANAGSDSSSQAHTRSKHDPSPHRLARRALRGLHRAWAPPGQSLGTPEPLEVLSPLRSRQDDSAGTGAILRTPDNSRESVDWSFAWRVKRVMCPRRRILPTERDARTECQRDRRNPPGFSACDSARRSTWHRRSRPHQRRLPRCNIDEQASGDSIHFCGTRGLLDGLQGRCECGWQHSDGRWAMAASQQGFDSELLACPERRRRGPRRLPRRRLRSSGCDFGPRHAAEGRGLDRCRRCCPPGAAVPHRGLEPTSNWRRHSSGSATHRSGPWRVIPAGKAAETGRTPDGWNGACSDGSGETFTWKIVNPDSGARGDGELSARSPVGKALVGHVEGEVVVVETRNGTRRLRIEQVE
jgi:hypothetical protein